MNNDLLTMKDGRMVIIRKGKMLPMDLDMTMSDGTKVMTNGSILRPDGTARQMLDGETINMAGEMSTRDDVPTMEETVDDELD